MKRTANLLLIFFGLVVPVHAAFYGPYTLTAPIAIDGDTLRADVQYGLAEARTTYGIIGVKVWVYRGDGPQRIQEERKPGSGM